MTTKDNWYPSSRSRDAVVSTTRAEFDKRSETHKRTSKSKREISPMDRQAWGMLPKPGQAATTIRLRLMAKRIRESAPLSWGMKVYLACIERGDPDECYLCSCVLNDGNRTADHVIPKSRGGGDGLSNLRLCCLRCNTKKGDLTLAEYRARAVA